jgi:hypothetical protein
VRVAIDSLKRRFELRKNFQFADQLLLFIANVAFGIVRLDPPMGLKTISDMTLSPAEN